MNTPADMKHAPAGLRSGRSPGAARQRGLSLVELMVAMALGAFITIGIIQMFSANQETYRVNVGQARMQESARFAMEFISSPLRMAGFTGCFSEPDEVFNNLILTGGNPPYEADFAAGILAGHEATTATVWSPGLGALPAAIPTADIVGGTDVLTVRLADPVGTRISGAFNDPTQAVPIRVPPDTTGYGTGNLLVISDCQKATVFQSTNTNAGFTSIQHIAGAAAATPGNIGAALSQDGVGFELDATVHALETQTFYIAPGAGTNNRGVAPLSLWRRFGSQNPVEMVEGIENLQVQFGVDTDADGIPNQYQTIQNVLDSAAIRTVQIQITANSVDVTDPDTTPAQVDADGDGVMDRGAPGVLRRVFSSTVAVRNLL